MCCCCVCLQEVCQLVVCLLVWFDFKNDLLKIPFSCVLYAFIFVFVVRVCGDVACDFYVFCIMSQSIQLLFLLLFLNLN